MGSNYPSRQEVRSLIKRQTLSASHIAGRAPGRQRQDVIDKTSRWLLDNESGLSLFTVVSIFALLFCTKSARFLTSRLYTLSYYNPATNQYAAGYNDLYFVAFWVVLLTGMRAGLIKHILRPLARRWGLSKGKQQVRFAEQAWMLIYYNVSWPFGMYIYYNSPYHLNMQQLWTDWPQREIGGQIKAYMLGQWAFWLHQVFVINLEDRRKDHWQMLTHHLITIALVASSYAYHQTRVGHVIMIALDIVDLVFPLAKCCRYLCFQTACDVLFGIFVVVWLVSRHVLLPMIIWSAYADSPRLGTSPCYSGTAEGLQGPLPTPSRWGYTLDAFRDPAGIICLTDNVRLGFLVCLMILQVLMIIWSFFIVRVATRVLRGDNAEDIRSDGEQEGTQ